MFLMAAQSCVLTSLPTLVNLAEHTRMQASMRAAMCRLWLTMRQT